jgi:subtilisin family serine protease
VITVVAAGNDSHDASSNSPAAYPEAITVSALADSDGEPGGTGPCWGIGPFCTQQDDAFASFSNFGAAVDVIAPGYDINSTRPGNAYGSASGTSMAAPHVAGVAALVRAIDPSLAPGEVLELLQRSGECPDVQSPDGTASTAGRCGSTQGSWPGDPDGITEPMTHAQGATAAACADEHEPNDSQAQATPIASDESRAGMLCPGDIDYFHLTVGADAGSTLAAEVTFDGGRGDLQLVLEDGAGSPLAVAEDSGDGRSLAYDVAAGDGGDYYLVVRGADAPLRYGLTASVVTYQGPVAVDDVLVTTEGTAATLNVLANDEHPEGDAFTLTAWDETSAQAGTVTCDTAARPRVSAPTRPPRATSVRTRSPTPSSTAAGRPRRGTSTSRWRKIFPTWASSSRAARPPSCRSRTG